jgi:hypothetical protein
MRVLSGLPAARVCTYVVRVRSLIIPPFALTLALAPVGCTEDPPTAPPAPIVVLPPNAAQGQAGSSDAKHGGTVVRLGPHPAEVVTHASGQVYAYVESDVPTPETGTMNVEVTVTGGRRPVELTWNRAQRRYEGRLVRETIVAGPVNVTYVIGGVTLLAFIPVCIVAPSINVRVHVDHHHGKHKHRHKWRH